MILLHDQMQDDRIWGRLRPELASFAEVRTVQPPPLHVLGARAWAAHIAEHARAALPAAVDLAVGLGGAGQAAVELVASGHAGAALLINPDRAPVVDESTVWGELAEPEADERLDQFFERLEPHLDGFTEHGTLSAEGIQALVDATFATADEPVDPAQLDLLRQMMTEQLTASVPVRYEQAAPDQPSWLTLLEAVPSRCTVAIAADRRIDAWADFETSLRGRVPEVGIVRLGTPGNDLLWQPAELAGLIRDLLDR